MIDYSQHPYKKLLEFIETGCQKTNEERDYVKFLLSMEQAESIEDLVKILNIIFKLLAVIHFGKTVLPQGWYKYTKWGLDNIYVIDLFSFFNENILRWCISQKRSKVLNDLCIANLRDGRNQYKIAEEITGVTHSKFDDLISKIERIRIKYSMFLIEFYRHGKSSVLKRYIGDLVYYGRILDITEEKTAKECLIDLENLQLKYKQGIYERKILEKEKRKLFISHIFMGIGIVLLIPIAMYIMNFLIDVIFLILIIIATFGMLKIK